ncbi:hypothetical protein [Thermopetrobacter sp. TC1]|uniref:hypothetical protein n=1 Tax=Thermopetrobacter sp. TC1 TaxID=1495045 RepID=UPI00068A6CEA|nr:hypothetical protein [Thermopetrobacter sp. TC1]
MIHYVIEFILWLLLAFLIGAIIGCLLRRLFAPASATQQAVPPQQAEAPPTAERHGVTHEEAKGAAAAVAGAGAGATGTATATATSEEGAASAASASAASEPVTPPEPEAEAAESGAKDGEQAAEAMPLMAGAASERQPEEDKAAAEAEKAAEKAEEKDKAKKEEAEKQETTSPDAEKDTAAEAAAKEESEKEEATAGGEAEKGAGEALPPFGLSAPIGGKPDNLTEISGIGKKIEKILHDLGIYHFRQIASWTEKEIAEVDARLKFKGRIQRERWVEQAKVLAEGGETEFAKRVKSGEVPTSRKS